MTPIEPGWYVSQNFIEDGGKPIAGPFVDKDDAFKARVGIETVHPTGMTYCIVEVEAIPPVELPNEPTLGWLTTDSKPMLDEWHAMTQIDPGYDDYGDWATGNKTGHRRESVTAFTPATAVPTDALDRLMEEPTELRSSVQLKRIIDDFLRAVDEAGGQS